MAVVSGTFAGIVFNGTYSTNSGTYNPVNSGSAAQYSNIYIVDSQSANGFINVGDNVMFSFSFMDNPNTTLTGVYQGYHLSGGTQYPLFNNGGGQEVLSGQTTIQPYAITAAPLTQVTCYVTGTRILTERGEVAVEDLRLGDLAVTASGERRPIKWIGRQTVDCTAHPDPLKAWPVRVARDALAPNRPARDLYVSPEHSLCVSVGEELLIPAFCLVNGASIAYAPCDHVTYWHVELDSHDLLVAENLPAESFLEMGENRRFFTGQAGIAALAEALSAEVMARTHADFCRPFLMAGPVIDIVRTQLAARAERLG